jgi:hypothetical protein
MAGHFGSNVPVQRLLSATKKSLKKSPLSTWLKGDYVESGQGLNTLIERLDYSVECWAVAASTAVEAGISSSCSGGCSAREPCRLPCGA